MRALVFGCTGQDGSLLCHSLLKQGVDVVGISRSSNPNLATHQALGIAGGLGRTTAEDGDVSERLEVYLR